MGTEPEGMVAADGHGVLLACLFLTISGEGILIPSHRAIEGDTEQIGGEGKHAR